MRRSHGNGSDDQAMEPISAAGYPELQLRSECAKAHSPIRRRDGAWRSTSYFVACRVGGTPLDPAKEKRDAGEEPYRECEVLPAAGREVLQVVIGAGNPRRGKLEPADYKRQGQLLDGSGQAGG